MIVCPEIAAELLELKFCSIHEKKNLKWVYKLPTHLSDWEQRGFVAYDFMTEVRMRKANTKKSC